MYACKRIMEVALGKHDTLPFGYERLRVSWRKVEADRLGGDRRSPVLAVKLGPILGVLGVADDETSFPSQTLGPTTPDVVRLCTVGPR